MTIYGHSPSAVSSGIWPGPVGRIQAGGSIIDLPRVSGRLNTQLMLIAERLN